MAVPQSTIDQIVALTEAGLSRATVADQLGVTRGVVCGLVHRLGIVPAAESPRIRKAPGGGRRQSAAQPHAPRAAGIIGVIRPPATLLELADDGCHWPIRWGSGRPIVFCNCGRTGSGHPSYCKRHAKRATRPDPRREFANRATIDAARSDCDRSATKRDEALRGRDVVPLC
jgi:hypothetical protein